MNRDIPIYILWAAMMLALILMLRSKRKTTTAPALDKRPAPVPPPMKKRQRENFERAFTAGHGGCRGDCHCGREFYNPGPGWTWDDGELEALQADPSATCLEWAVSWVRIDGIEYCADCDCWITKAERIVGWLTVNRKAVAEFYRLELERMRAEVADVPVVDDSHESMERIVARAGKPCVHNWLPVGNASTLKTCTECGVIEPLMACNVPPGDIVAPPGSSKCTHNWISTGEGKAMKCTVCGAESPF